MQNEIIQGVIQAVILIVTFDQEIWFTVILSISISGIATFIAGMIGLPIGSLMGLRDFWGKKSVTNLLNTFMGFPPVIMGLFVFLLLSKSGPLGFLGLLYTPTAMIIAQLLLAIPIIAGTTKAAIESVDPGLKETIQSLGATEIEVWWELIKDSKRSIIAGILVAFGQAISEVGAVMIVGGNIRWHTRVFTTSIVYQTQ
ncbi:MAG: ABC transporter permease, partial [Promethearchaeota archaeon]